VATPNEATRIAFDLFEAGRTADAETLCRRVLDAAPGLVSAAHLLGVILCGAERFADAAPFLKNAVAGSVASPDAAVTLAKALVRLEDWSAAAGAARRAVAIDPGHAEGWDVKALAERRVGTADAVILALERAVRCESAPSAARLGAALRERGARRLDELDLPRAVSDLARAAELAPLDAEVRNALGTAMFESGNVETARSCFRGAIVIAPDAGGPLRGLGIAHLKAGDRGGATRLLSRAACLLPDDPAPAEAMTQALLDTDPVAAREWSSRALRVKLERSRRSGGELVLFVRGATDGPGEGRTRNIISLSLWGDLTVYLNGALALVEQARARLPGWVCRFHHDGTVPPGVLEELRARGAELVLMPEGEAGRLGMFWRFLPLDDPSVARVLPRDCDSLLTMREVAAIEAWVASGVPFHVMRDHAMHMEPVMGGMWGAVAGEPPPILPAIRRFERERTARWNDQHFLADWLWPKIARRVLVHDEIHPEAGTPFPIAGAEEEGHVGAKLFPLTRLPAVVALDDPRVETHVERLGEWMGLETALLGRLVPPSGRVVDLSAETLSAPIGDPVDLLRVAVRGVDPALFDAMVRSQATAVHLKVDDDRAGAEAARRLMSAGYRLWRHLIPAFDPDNPKGARVPPEPGLIAVAILALRDGLEPPIPLVPMTAPDDDWRPVAWRLRWNGSARV